jgi:hypothetical protein
VEVNSSRFSKPEHTAHQDCQHIPDLAKRCNSSSWLCFASSPTQPHLDQAQWSHMLLTALQGNGGPFLHQEHYCFLWCCLCLAALYLALPTDVPAPPRTHCRRRRPSRPSCAGSQPPTGAPGRSRSGAHMRA